MTLEEAKKELKKLYEEKHEAFLRTSMSLFDAEANGIKEAIKIVDKIDDEPVGKSDKLTLTGLAYELRKIFRFKYLAVDNLRYKNELTIWTYECRPVFDSKSGTWYSAYGNEVGFFLSDFVKHLDLSEYEDESGYIDYSKCIVEVE